MSNPAKVLIIDDEENLCSFLKKNLELIGKFKVFTANNGQAGIALAKSEKPDIIILDIMMPQMAGPEVADILKARPETKNIPIVFLTAIITKEEIGINEIRQIGGCNYIAKPVETDKLIECINEILNDNL
ncbi:MAG: response regulator [Candidatus Omnitrophota bacterium]